MAQEIQIEFLNDMSLLLYGDYVRSLLFEDEELIAVLLLAAMATSNVVGQLPVSKIRCLALQTWPKEKGSAVPKFQRRNLEVCGANVSSNRCSKRRRRAGSASSKRSAPSRVQS